MKRLLAILSTLGLVTTVAIAALDGCRPTDTTPVKLTVYLTTDSIGYLEPCGCRRDQAGGLPGRATLIGQTQPSDRIVLDAGNLTPGGRPYEQLKTRYMMEGMKTIGYDAVNIGKAEASLDLNTLRSMLPSLPFVSANVVTKRDGVPVTMISKIIKRGSLRIGVTGVTELDTRDTGPGILVKPPVESLASVVGDLRKQCDYLIVLAYVNEDTQRKIAERYPEIDCILGGDVQQSSAVLQTFNRASVFNVTEKGKVLGEITIVKHGSAYRADDAVGVKVMADRIEKDAKMLSLIQRFKDELRDKRFDLASAEGMVLIGSGTGTANQYMGYKACASCHVKQHKIYLETQHYYAYNSLTKGSQYDPECLKCHTMGYGLYSGFVSMDRTPALANVQCESCHGRGKNHIDKMQQLEKMGMVVHHNKVKPQAHFVDDTLKPVTPASCITCHDRENSENFHYSTFYPKIVHLERTTYLGLKGVSSLKGRLR